MARVLVTGASGFIGTALAPRLAAAGHTPRLLFRRRPAAAPPGDVVEGALAEPATLAAAVTGSDAVVHLGAATSSGRLDPAVAYRVNVGGASALIAAARAAGCPRIVVMSTQHVHLPRPGLYGVTKRVADRLFLASGLDVTILRPSLVYGPGARGSAAHRRQRARGDARGAVRSARDPTRFRAPSHAAGRGSPADVRGRRVSARPPLRAAVVGAGRMGMVHGHLLQVHPETELVGFVDRDTSLAEHLASQGLRAPLYPSVAALYAAAPPDAVFVCTPTHTHVAVVRECLARRVHLFVEKPLATSRADAEAILRLATDAGVMHAAGYVYAHLPVVQAAHDLVAAGALGELLRFTAHAYVSEVFGPKKGWV